MDGLLTLALLADCNCSLQGIKPFMAMQMFRGCEANRAVLSERHCSCHCRSAELQALSVIQGEVHLVS